ncbi:MAG: hypothetical protein CMF96_02185 [Candidatus Marinimicrobia bacterium]|nr:hypothetical protein [Candidatus Neomarinimicrobiota bacterium]|tara:strand:- start:6429 stop:7502 length:1074 start_codon:yes stop_codon:yes gene_type:complete
MKLHKNPERNYFIDKKFYLSDEIFKNSVGKIFRKNPLYIGHKSAFNPNIGLYPISVYPELLNEEIILKFQDNQLNEILSNVCTHRAHLLLDSPCRKKTFQCPYHGRKFDNNGKVKSAPGFDNQLNEIKKNENLSKYSFIEFLNFYFLTNTENSIYKIIQNYSNLFNWFPYKDLKPEKSNKNNFEINAHWALYVENYLEGLHIPFIHKGLTKEINMNNYKVELLPKATLQTAIGKSSENTFSIFDNCPEKFKKIAAFYFWIYPNIMINIYSWGISVNIIEPVSKEKTLIRYETFLLDSKKQKKGAGGNLHKVELEDQDAVLKVQKGLKSSKYFPGKISSIHELGVNHFHKLLTKDLYR